MHIVGGDNIHDKTQENNENIESMKNDKNCPSNISDKIKEKSDDEDFEIQIKNLTDALLRKTADFENFKKRSARELNEYKKFSTERMIGKMIEVCDSFELAIVSAKKTDNSESIIKGIEMIFKQFFSILEAEGLKKIPLCIGDEFDPNMHNAICQTESCEFKNNTIMEILKHGYSLHSKVIRHASVIVAKNTNNV